MTQAELLERRAFDAVARCLIRQLTIPRVYFEAAWPDPSHRVDVLAIDRDGAGDVHVVEVKRFARDAAAYLPNLLAKPGAFKWLAVFTDGAAPDGLATLAASPQEGQGRVGVIAIVSRAGDLGANIVSAAERFPGSSRAEAAKFVASTAADVAFGADEFAEPPTQPGLASDSFEDRLNDARELRRTGYQAAALLVAWGALEALMRRIARHHGDVVDRKPATHLVRLLRSYDSLSAEDESLLQRSFVDRNNIAHGYRLEGDLATSLDDLLELAERLKPIAAADSAI